MTGQSSIVQHSSIVGNVAGLGVLVQGGGQSVCGNVLSNDLRGIELPGSSGTGAYAGNIGTGNGTGILVTSTNVSQGNWGKGQRGRRHAGDVRAVS